MVKRPQSSHDEIELRMAAAGAEPPPDSTFYRSARQSMARPCRRGEPCAHAKGSCASVAIGTVAFGALEHDARRRGSDKPLGVGLAATVGRAGRRCTSGDGQQPIPCDLWCRAQAHLASGGGCAALRCIRSWTAPPTRAALTAYLLTAIG